MGRPSNRTPRSVLVESGITKKALTHLAELSSERTIMRFSPNQFRNLQNLVEFATNKQGVKNLLNFLKEFIAEHELPPVSNCGPHVDLSELRKLVKEMGTCHKCPDGSIDTVLMLCDDKVRISINQKTTPVRDSLFGRTETIEHEGPLEIRGVVEGNTSINLLHTPGPWWPEIDKFMWEQKEKKKAELEAFKALF